MFCLVLIHLLHTINEVSASGSAYPSLQSSTLVVDALEVLSASSMSAQTGADIVRKAMCGPSCTLFLSDIWGQSSVKVDYAPALSVLLGNWSLKHLQRAIAAADVHKSSTLFENIACLDVDKAGKWHHVKQVNQEGSLVRAMQDCFRSGHMIRVSEAWAVFPQIQTLRLSLHRFLHQLGLPCQVSSIITYLPRRGGERAKDAVRRCVQRSFCVVQLNDVWCGVSADRDMFVYVVRGQIRLKKITTFRRNDDGVNEMEDVFTLPPAAGDVSETLASVLLSYVESHGEKR